MPKRFEDGPDRIWCWDRDSLLADGYQATGIVVTEDEATVGRTRTVAQELDLTIESVATIRTGVDRWEYFRTPEATSGYVEHPILPF